MNLKDYFYKHQYKPTYYIGDRVEGHYHNIMFVGTVLNDSVISEDQEPVVSVYLDLPLIYNQKQHNILFVNPSELKLRSQRV